jgi:hypothetical protein
MSNDGEVSFSAWAESVRDASVEQVYRRFLYELRNFDIVERNDAAFFVHWIDPCDEPIAGFIAVKTFGSAAVSLSGRWPEGATDNLRPVFEEIFSRLEAVPPGLCPLRQWLNQPSHYTFRSPKSEHAGEFEVVSHPNWICPPFAFPIPPFRNEGVPETPVPKEPFYW